MRQLLGFLMVLSLAIIFFACGGGGGQNVIRPKNTVQTFFFLSEASGGLFQPMGGNLTGGAFTSIGQPGNIWSIAASPDGKKFVYDTPGNSSWDIFVANSDGTHVVQITDDAETDEEPTFSPDGSKVIFTSYRGDQGSYMFDIIVANADGSGQTDITPNSTMDHRFAVFSPDGTKIAFSGYDPVDIVWGIWIMNADGTGLKNVISETSYDTFSLPLTFSPDGTQIFYSGTTIDPSTTDIYAINIDGTNLLQLTNTGVDWYPRFDGSTLLFNTLQDSNAEIYTMNADGSGARRLTNNGVYDSFSQSVYVDSPSARIRSGRAGHNIRLKAIQ